MKQIYRIVGALLLLPLLASCFKDNSTPPTKPISKLEAVEQLPPRYEIEYNEVLRIEAPAVTQSTAELPLSYEWEINHKVMSKEKTLEFKGTDYGKFPGRLTIKNNDSYLFMEFEVEVSYPYTGGIYALAEYDGTTVLTYVPNSEKRGVELNALSQFNPNKSFGSQPKALHFLGYYGTELAYVSVGTPNKLFRFDPNTMLLLNEVSPPSEATIDYITSGPNSLEIDVVESSKKLASLKRTETIFNNGLYRSLRDKKPGEALRWLLVSFTYMAMMVTPIVLFTSITKTGVLYSFHKPIRQQK